MRRCTCIVMALAMVAVVGGAASAAEVYWDGDTGTDFFDVTNWSTTRPANSDPLAVPGPGDTVVWARDAAVANRPYFGASVSFDAYVRDTSAADFAWNNGPAGTVVELLGADYDLAPIGGWGLTPDVVVAANGGMAFASNIELSLAGGNNVFYAANGWMEIQGNISETAPSDLQKLGYARTQFRGDFGLSGNIWLRQGELEFYNGLDVAGTGGTLTISPDSEGGFKSFVLRGGQDHVFAGADIQGTPLAPGSYTKADLDGLGLGAKFGTSNGTDGTITVIPEPATLALLGLSMFALIRRKR